MNIRFVCPGCRQPARLTLPAPAGWQCPSCCHALSLQPVPATGALPDCAVCGNPQLYKKKDFPQRLGLTILTVACLAFLAAHYRYYLWWAWTILLGSFLFDSLLYLWVGDVVVCYRCGAQYRGLTPEPAYQPFDLGIAERYRQERLRLEKSTEQ